MTHERQKGNGIDSRLHVCYAMRDAATDVFSRRYPRHRGSKPAGSIAISLALESWSVAMRSQPLWHGSSLDTGSQYTRPGSPLAAAQLHALRPERATRVSARGAFSLAASADAR